jgi:hypothetical protein
MLQQRNKSFDKSKHYKKIEPFLKNNDPSPDKQSEKAKQRAFPTFRQQNNRKSTVHTTDPTHVQNQQWSDGTPCIEEPHCAQARQAK